MAFVHSFIHSFTQSLFHPIRHCILSCHYPCYDQCLQHSDHPTASLTTVTTTTIFFALTQPQRWMIGRPWPSVTARNLHLVGSAVPSYYYYYYYSSSSSSSYSCDYQHINSRSHCKNVLKCREQKGGEQGLYAQRLWLTHNLCVIVTRNQQPERVVAFIAPVARGRWRKFIGPSVGTFLAS